MPISNINNGESGLSVRNTLNALIDAFNAADIALGDLFSDQAAQNGRLDALEAMTFSFQDVTDIDNSTTNALYLNRPDGQPALIVMHSGLDCVDVGVRSGGGGYINLKDEADNTTIVIRGTGGGFMQIGGYDVATINTLTAYQGLSEKGANNGYASLDSGGKVPASQLPSTLMTLQGNWNATTNTPTLVNGVGDIGDVYECTVAGTVDFGAGPITFKVGDWVVCGAGSVWYKSLNSNEVTSVNGQTGTVVLSTNHISEGTNLYFTDARARTAAVENDLTASTTIAPSKTAVNNALALKLDRANVFVGWGANLSMANSTTYFNGIFHNFAPSTSGSNSRKFRAPITGNFLNFGLSVQLTTASVGANTTIQLHNITKGTSVNITTTHTWSTNSFFYSGFSLFADEGDLMEMRYITGAFSTAPTAIQLSGTLTIQAT